MKKIHWKKIHLKKPDIKGGIHKLKNLKKEDVKAYWSKKRKTCTYYRREKKQCICQKDETGLSFYEPVLSGVPCAPCMLFKLCD